MKCSPQVSSAYGISQARILECIAIFFSRKFFLTSPGIKPVSPALAGRFFTTEPQGGPHNICSVQSSHSVVSDSLPPHESQHVRPPCPSPTPGVHSNSCASSQFTTIEAPYFSDPSYIPGCLAFCSHDLIDSDTKLWFYIFCFLSAKLLSHFSCV